MKDLCVLFVQSVRETFPTHFSYVCTGDGEKELLPRDSFGFFVGSSLLFLLDVVLFFILFSNYRLASGTG